MADDDKGWDSGFGPLPPIGSEPGAYVEGERVGDEPTEHLMDSGVVGFPTEADIDALPDKPGESRPLLGVVPPPHETLAAWWHRMADVDLAMLGPKVEEYGGSGGSYDLDLVGRILADTTGRHDADRPTREELGCFHYLTGKLGRMAAAYREGKLPSDDTIVDAIVYLMMIRRIREVGGWPWSAGDE